VGCGFGRETPYFTDIMPGIIHRLFGRDDNKKRVGLLQEMYDKVQGDRVYECQGLWSRGESDGWYTLSKSGTSVERKTWGRWWRRSLPGHIGLELLMYLGVYYLIHLIYKLALNNEQQKQFGELAIYFNDNLSTVGRDLAFLLGFYVKQTVGRWWSQYQELPYPDKLPSLTHALVDYSSTKSQQFSHHLVRYSLLAYVLCLRRISKALRKMFPSDQSLTDSGLATSKEINIIKSEGDKDMGKVWWIPLSWAMTMVRRSKEDKVIASDQKIMVGAIANFQSGLEKVDNYDHCVFPPVYRQVVTLALYVYFALSLIGEQELVGIPDIVPFFPGFLILKFVFFFGWLEVADAIENPWGCDEDDFQICHLLSRHVWALGKNLEQFPGPPNEGVEEEEHEDFDRKDREINFTNDSDPNNRN